VIQIEFELMLTDEPLIARSFSYSFEGVFLEVIDRQMTSPTIWGYDAETERPDTIDRLPCGSTP
jgi:hypothetical protein